MNHRDHEQQKAGLALLAFFARTAATVAAPKSNHPNNRKFIKK